MYNERQEAILSFVAEGSVATQKQLVDMLNKGGFCVTQATVSRDIKMLGLKKESDESGRIRYVCPDSELVPDHFQSVLKEGFISSDVAVNILVIKTVPGMAMAVAAALDAYRFPELVGCIAGDDTIMCAIRDARSAKELQKKIERLRR